MSRVHCIGTHAGLDQHYQVKPICDSPTCAHIDTGLKGHCINSEQCPGSVVFVLAYRVSNVQAYTVSSSGVFVAGLYCGCVASGLCLFVPPYSTLTSLLLRNYLWMPGVMLYMYIHSTAIALAHNSRACAYM